MSDPTPMRSPPPPIDLLLANAGWVKSLARRIVDDRHDAEEIAQETLLRALERPPSRADSPPRLRGWLARVARNFALQKLRHDESRRRREHASGKERACRVADDAGTALNRPPARDLAEVVAHAELHRRVVDAVLSLPEPYRTTLLLRFFEELPPPLIAARLSIPLATVHTRLRRALEQLRTRFSDERLPGGSMATWIALESASSPLREIVVMGIKLGVRARLAGAALLALVTVGSGLYFAVVHDSPQPASAPDDLDSPVGADSLGAVAVEPLRITQPPALELDAVARESAAKLVFVGGVTLAGCVVDEAGEAIAGAGATRFLSGDADIQSSSADLVDEQLAAFGLAPSAAAPPRIMGVTSSDGRFELDGARHGLRYRVEVAAPGYLPGTIEWPDRGAAIEAESRSTVRLPTIVLAHGAPLAIQVIDSVGAAVAGAEIYANAVRDGFATASVHPLHRRATSSGDGRASVTLPYPGTFWIAARARDGRMAMAAPISWPPNARDEAPLVIRLTDGAPTRVIVRLADGTPLPGIELQLRATLAGGSCVQKALTDDSGRATFPAAPTGDRQLFAGAPGGTVSLFGEAARAKQLLATGQSEVELVVELARPPIAVRFVDAEDLTPVAARSLLVVDAEIGEREHSWPAAFSGVATRGIGSIGADATGGVVVLAPPRTRPRDPRAPFADRPLQDSRFRLVIDAPGYAVTWLGPFDPAELRRDAPLELRIERGRSVALTARDSRGAPLSTARAHVVGPGAAISVSSYSHHQAIEQRGAKADSNGHLSIGPLARGPHRLFVEAPGHLPSELAVTIGEGSAAPIEVTLAAGATQLGAVRLRPDESPRRFVVALRSATGGAPLTSGLDDDGDFEFGPLAPGEWELLAFEREWSSGASIDVAGRFDTAPAERVRITLAADEEPPFVELDPVRLDRETAPLDLAIVDQPIGATVATVRALTRDGQRFRREFAIEGGRVLASLPIALRYLLSLAETLPDGRRFTVASRTVTPAELRAGLAPWRVARGSLALRLVTNDGAPLEGTSRVVISYAFGDDFSASFAELLSAETRSFTFGDGALRPIDGLPADRIGVHVTAGELTGSASIELATDVTTECEVVLSRTP